MIKFYAHSIEGKPVEEWQGLEYHLEGTAELAKSFADEFGCGEWGYLAGIGGSIQGNVLIIKILRDKMLQRTFNREGTLWGLQYNSQTL